MSIIPEPLRKQIDEVAKTSLGMNIANNDDPVDEDCTDEGDSQKENR